MGRLSDDDDALRSSKSSFFCVKKEVQNITQKTPKKLFYLGFRVSSRFLEIFAFFLFG